MIKVINSNPLSEYLGKVPSAFYESKVQQLIEGCGLQKKPNKFANWVKGITQVPESAQILINQITNKQIFEI